MNTIHFAAEGQGDELMGTFVNPLPRWEELLRDVNPVREAERLASAVPDPATATVDDCWEQIWPKPLFTNTRVETGQKYVKDLGEFMDGAWRNWGLGEGAFNISYRGTGNQRDNFEVSGREHSKIDDLGIARHRLFAIQGGANLLRALVHEAPAHPNPMQHLRDLDDLGKRVEYIQKYAGYGWGHITALHLLTDFGLAVKPDRHLVNTIQKIGLLPDLPERDVPNLNEALQINDAVDELGRRIFGQDFGRRNRRYLDKILMELSRQNLLDAINS